MDCPGNPRNYNGGNRNGNFNSQVNLDLEILKIDQDMTIKHDPIIMEVIEIIGTQIVVMKKIIIDSHIIGLVEIIIIKNK